MNFRSIWIEEASADHVDFVIRRMRADDAKEAYACRFNDSADDLIFDVLAQRSLYAPLKALGRLGHPAPIALIGILMVQPRVGLAHLIATDGWPAIVKDATRWLRNELIPNCRVGGYRRVEVRAMAALTRSCAWIEALGAEPEAELPMLGKHGETYAQYAWVDWERRAA
jgi:hypothetical protein